MFNLQKIEIVKIQNKLNKFVAEPCCRSFAELARQSWMDIHLFRIVSALLPQETLIATYIH